MIKLIVFLCFLAVALIVCGLASFKTEKVKLLELLAVKGLAILSIIILALISSNLTATFSASTMFVILALAIELFSVIVSSLPTKSDLFAPLYMGLDMMTSIMLSVSGLLFVKLSPFGFPIGLGAGLIVMAVYGIIKKKNFNYKTDLFRYLNFSIACGLLGQFVIILLSNVSIQAIMFSIASILYFAYAFFATFITTDKKPILITKNILLHLSLITFAISIFLGMY